jgi:hypothetical protein
VGYDRSRQTLLVNRATMTMMAKQEASIPVGGVRPVPADVVGEQGHDDHDGGAQGDRHDKLEAGPGGRDGGRAGDEGSGAAWGVGWGVRGRGGGGQG